MKKILFFAASLFLVLLYSNASFAQHWRRSGCYDRNDGWYNNHYGSYCEPVRYYSYNYRPYYRPSVSISFGRADVDYRYRQYNYYGSSYYQPYDYNYQRVAPRIGEVVSILPSGYSAIVIGSNTYYTYDNVYYAPLPDNTYQVINRPEDRTYYSSSAPAPVNPIIPSAAPSTEEEYKKIVIDGKTYYQKGDTYYKAVVDAKGEIQYKVVGQTTK